MSPAPGPRGGHSAALTQSLLFPLHPPLQEGGCCPSRGLVRGRSSLETRPRSGVLPGWGGGWMGPPRTHRLALRSLLALEACDAGFALGEERAVGNGLSVPPSRSPSQPQPYSHPHSQPHSHPTPPHFYPNSVPSPSLQHFSCPYPSLHPYLHPCPHQIPVPIPSLSPHRHCPPSLSLPYSLTPISIPTPSPPVSSIPFPLPTPPISASIYSQLCPHPHLNP